MTLNTFHALDLSRQPIFLYNIEPRCHPFYEVVMMYFSEELIFIHPDCDEKLCCIKKMVTDLQKSGYMENSDDFLQKVLAREESMSTGIGYGIAIPHGRSASVSRLKIIVYILDKAIDFDSIDRQPVRLIFMFAVPLEGKDEYMPVLGAVTRFLRERENRARLMDVSTAKEAMEILGEIKIGSE